MTYTVEREVVTGTKTVRVEIKKLEDWKRIEFESSSYCTPEFNAFNKMFRVYICREAKKKCLSLEDWSKGHFYCTAFFRHLITGKFVYLSISDVRGFKNKWADEIMVRTAKGPTDYTGGPNRYTNLVMVGEALRRLTV